MRSFVFVLLISVLALSSWADCTSPNAPPQTFASEKITVSSTALGFTAATVSGALRAYCSVEDDSVRFNIQALPTSTAGVLVAAGSYIEVCAADIPRFLVIRVTADAELNCLYQR